MKSTSTFFLFATLVLPILIVCVSPTAYAQEDVSNWSRWRGPQGDGIAAGQTPVTAWSETSNVIWKSKVPGHGHSSPIVTADKIFLTTSDKAKGTQSVLCYDRDSGALVWENLVYKGKLPEKIHKKNTHASSSVAVHGDQLFALFFNAGRQLMVSFRFDGEKVWEKDLGPYETEYDFGSGASPIMYGDVVIVPHENAADGKIYGLNYATGETLWTIPRTHSSYSTPVVANVGGKDQLLISGHSGLTSYDPVGGKKNWSSPAKWKVTCATAVWDEDRIYASGGYPVRETIAVTNDGAKQVWELPLKSYEQSMIVVDDHLYLVTDRGILYCVHGATGEIAWKTRFKGPISASPVLAGGNIYFTAEDGQTLVFKPNPAKFEKVGINQLGTRAFASFALVDDRIITRVGDDSTGEYQEWLYCLGK